jgi:transcriptional antiterminator RfaH
MFPDSHWYLVQCKPRESFRAAMHLENQGYTCFHPTYHVKRKRAGTISLVLEPLFSHYLFVQLSLSDNWSSIRSTRGVSRLVYFDGVPAKLDSLTIETLQRQCAKLNGEPVQSLYQVGDCVVITDGCFNEVEAVVTAVSGDERVSLLFNLFNRQQCVDLSVKALKKVA